MSEYIRNMRSIIEKSPLLLVGSSVIAINNNQVLLQKRADTHVWGYPGGCMKLGESPEETAKREFYEETGFEANSIKLYGVFAGEHRHYIYANGDEVYITDIVYVCDNFTITEKQHDNEVLELKWFPFNEIPENLSPTIKDILLGFIRNYTKI